MVCVSCGMITKRECTANHSCVEFLKEVNAKLKTERLSMQTENHSLEQTNSELKRKNFYLEAENEGQRDLINEANRYQLAFWLAHRSSDLENHLFL